MEFGIFIVIALVLIGIFFLCRQLNCWYFKINERIEIMQKMLKNQEKMKKLLNDSSTNKITHKESANKKESKGPNKVQEIKVGDDTLTK